MRESASIVDEKVVRQLFELAETAFTLRAFRERWEAFGWSYHAGQGDNFGFRVRVNDRQFLMVDPLGDEVLCASLPFWNWEKYEPSWHEDRLEYERERAEYQGVFEEVKALALRVLPPAAAVWTDADAEEHEAVVWRCACGLLVLQQAAFDMQFGLELNFWLARQPAEGFRPTTPFIDWLCELSSREHAAREFPPLVW